MDFIVYTFILIYLPKYILHSVNIYDLGNSHWKFYMYLLIQFDKNI